MNDISPIDLVRADPVPDARTVLHVGCGAADPAKLPPAYFPADSGWRELRLDIDPEVQPDIVASLTDMAAVPDASVDAVWSAHNLEHLWAHEVPVAMAEFLRVLRPGGFALVTMPDLQQVAERVAAGQLEEAAYVSPMGPWRRSTCCMATGRRWRAAMRSWGTGPDFTASTLPAI